MRQRSVPAGPVLRLFRAKAAGKLRADFVTEDMPMFLMANAGVLTATGDAAPDTWRRLVGYLIQACAAQAAQPLPDPPAPRQMYKAMLRATWQQRERRARKRSSSSRLTRQRRSGVPAEDEARYGCVR